jgi:hypothetical protein
LEELSMSKILISVLALLVSFSSYSDTHISKKYVLVVFHGMGSGNDFKEEDTFSEDLKTAGVVKMYNAGHDVSNRDLKEILKNFECRDGKQNKPDLGLIIMGYSWGARVNYEFSKDYLKKCGQKVDRAYMIDGIQKIASQFKHAPVANVCINYYKTTEPIRGRALEGCENHDLTEVCKQEDGDFGDGMECHGKVLNAGMELALKDIAQWAAGSANLDLFIQEI